jgi:large-conductance mechanosensitive channel
MMLIVTSTVIVHADDCKGVFGTDLINQIKEVFRFIKIIAPIILLVLTSLDFAKVVFSDSKDGMTKAKNNFLKRAVATLIIFFAPDIIILIMQIIDDESIKNAANCIPNFK